MAFLAPLAIAALAGGGAAAAGGSLATALAVGGTLFSGVSAFQQGQYQGAVAKNNAQIATRNAALESEASQIEGVRSDREYATALGEQLAAQGASGFDILGRTQLATRNAMRETGRAAATDIRADGTARARGLLQDAANFKAEGRGERAQGTTALVGSLFEAGSSFAKGTGRTSSLVSSRRGKPRPWSTKPNWYGK